MQAFSLSAQFAPEIAMVTNKVSPTQNTPALQANPSLCVVLDEKNNEATPSLISGNFHWNDFHHYWGEAIKFNPNPELNSAYIIHWSKNRWHLIFNMNK